MHRLTAEQLITAAEEKLMVIRSGETKRISAEFCVNMPFKTVMQYIKDGIILYTPKPGENSGREKR